MKKILIGVSLLGIIFNPLSAGQLYSPTPEPTDTYNLNSSLNGAAGVIAINSIDDALYFLESEHNYDPAAVGKTHSNIGNVWTLDNSKVFSWTGTDPGFVAEYIVVEDNSTTPSSFKLDAVMGSDYQGAPLVENVYAEQIAGSKNVRIDFSVLLASDLTGGAGPAEKASYIEFWFKSDPTSPQWEECQTFVVNSEGGPSDPNQKNRGSLDSSGEFYATWDAGTDKPNFKTDSGKIRVLVSYNRMVDGTNVSGSQWDGYEVDMGPTFSRVEAEPMIDYPQAATEFSIYAHQQNLSRVGSYNHLGKILPVFQLTSTQLSDLSGTGGIPDGKFAFGEVENDFGTQSPKFIPVN